MVKGYAIHTLPPSLVVSWSHSEISRGTMSLLVVSRSLAMPSTHYPPLSWSHCLTVRYLVVRSVYSWSIGQGLCHPHTTPLSPCLMVSPRRMPRLADTADEPRSPSMELHTYPKTYSSSVSSMSYPRCLCTVPSLLEDLPLTVAAAVMSLSTPEAPNQLPTWRSDSEGASLQHISAEVWHPQPNQSG